MFQRTGGTESKLLRPQNLQQLQTRGFLMLITKQVIIPQSKRVTEPLNISSTKFYLATFTLLRFK